MYLKSLLQKAKVSRANLIALHLETKKHKTGKNKTRKDKKLRDKCPFCDYTSKKNQTMEQHILNKHATKSERREKFPYYCNDCDFGTFHELMYSIHIASPKHLGSINKD